MKGRGRTLGLYKKCRLGFNEKYDEKGRKMGQGNILEYTKRYCR